MHRGLISRASIGRELRLSNRMQRAAEVEALFIAVEQRLKLSLSSSSKHDVHAARLKEILADGEVPLRNGRPMVAWAARELNISEAVVQTTPLLRKILADYAHPRAQSADASAIRGITIEKAEVALALLGISRQAVSRALLTHFSSHSPATAKTNWRVFFNFLHWLNRTGYDNILRAWSDGATPTKAALEEATWAWRDELASTARVKATTATTYVGNLRNILEVLAHAGLAPEIAPLRPLRDSRRKTDPRPTFGQVLRDPVLGLMDDQARSLGLEAWSRERVQFVAALREEADRLLLAPENLIEAMRSLNRNRLNVLRSVCESICVEAWRRWNDGQTLLASHEGRAQTTFTKLAARARQGGDDHLLGDYLHAVREECAGLVPRGRQRSSSHHAILLALGGYDAVAGHLHALPKTVSATAIVYLIDSGANVPVARELVADSIQPSTQSGFCTIAGNKGSARGKAIRPDLPRKRGDGHQSSVEALQNLRAMTQPLRRSAPRGMRDLIFLHRPGQTVKSLHAYSLNEELRRIVAATDELAGMHLSPAMIRPSVLLDMALADEGRLAAVKAVAHHATVSQTDGYTRKYPVRLLYEERVRHFQNVVQSIIVTNAALDPCVLALSPGLVTDLAAEGLRTGLGTLCRSPMASPQAGVPDGEHCSRLDMCSTCSARFIIAEPSAIADMLLFSEALKTAEADWIRDRPQRWDNVWLPWLAMSQVVIEKMSRGPLARILREAREIADARKGAGERLIQPW